ncbi:MAG: Mth938-like domain-containing protein [Candidatus Aminicenantales bacterium]
MIESYKFGAMVVDGKTYTADLILLPDRTISSWWRKEGHRLCLDDLSDVLAEEIEVFVIGTGFYGLMKILPEVRHAFQAKGIALFAEKTAKAVGIFNKMADFKRTAGGFHLTC